MTALPIDTQFGQYTQPWRPCAGCVVRAREHPELADLVVFGGLHARIADRDPFAADAVANVCLLLEGILGNATAEQVLLYLEQYGEGYARAIAVTFDELPVSMVQRQLQRLEAAGILVSQLKGRTRLFV